ncbi:MAG TPA: hypothetical protein VJ911_10565 [Cryomorphaceae bacterium]|nr:hypothetical protein [Cryomorphaceae bacterium]
MSDLIDLNIPQFWNSEPKIALETIRQIEKDFALQGITVEFEFPIENYPEVIGRIAQRLETLSIVHLPAFPALAYQIDLNEAELKSALAVSQPDETYHILAGLILRRCFKKVWWRWKMKSNRKEK